MKESGTESAAAADFLPKVMASQLNVWKFAASLSSIYPYPMLLTETSMKLRLTQSVTSRLPVS